MDKNDLFDVFAYEIHYADGISVLKEGSNTVFMTETEGTYIKQTIPPDPERVATQTTYFANTLTISGEGQFLKGWDLEIGIWKEYDREGQLINEVNKDEHYPISWGEMKGCFLANDIRITEIRQLRRTQDPTSGRYCWVLTLKSDHGILDTACFDAETGELIKREQTMIEVI